VQVYGQLSVTDVGFWEDNDRPRGYEQRDFIERSVIDTFSSVTLWSTVA
jgi:hypothetical protein